LVAENEEYQKAACDADAITILANFIKDTTGDVTPYLREVRLINSNKTFLIFFLKKLKFIFLKNL